MPQEVERVEYTQKIDITLSTDENKNIAMENVLEILEGKIEIERTTCCQSIMEEKRELPLIQTDTGLNYFGIKSIRRFVRRELVVNPVFDEMMHRK